MRKRTTTKKLGAGIVLLLIATVVFFAIIFPNTSGQKYKKANELLANGQYATALEIFEELGDYQDAPALLLESRYVQANTLLSYREYQSALLEFTALGDYRDSLQKIEECYFGLGKDAFDQANYEEAVSCFLQAGESADVRAELDKAYYEWGHQLFVKGLYVAAENKFAQIQTYPEYAQPHFQYLSDAREYLNEQAAMLSSEITCYISQRPIPPPADSLWDVVTNYVPFQSGSVYYDDAEKTLKITAKYHAGRRILSAWESGDVSGLSDDEKQAMELAGGLVADAKSFSEDPLEIELYLFNWLCDNVVYESPDMDVDTETYMGLRQLNCVGALLDGKANCQGYTDAFYLLGNMAGLDVCTIGGTGEWEPHAWNGIMLNGKLYFVDVTFGDSDNMGEKGKTYAWFNCSYDPETYTIDGGEGIFPELVMDNDLSQTYYHSRDMIFDSVGDAAYYLLRQYRNGEDWGFAAVEGVELDNDDVKWALQNNYQRAGVWSYNCTWLLYTYGGNSYITVRWD